MPITLSEKPGQQVPAGIHQAICHRITDIGTQPDTGYGEKRKIVINWELPFEKIVVDGVEKPMSISKIYTSSLNKKASLRQHLKAWRGRDFTAEELKHFELKNILGKGCQVNVVHNDEGRANVDSVVALPKGQQVNPAVNPLVEYSIDEGKNKTYEALPEWLRKMCDACLEWNGGVAEPGEAEPLAELPPEDGDVPF